jgi:uncharacterized RDD family membrane protein YckC
MEISIKTTQHVNIDYALASLGERVAVFFIDLAIQVAYALLVAGFLSYAKIDINALVIILVSIPFATYDLISELLMNGQTIGKRVMGLKVISLSGKQPSAGQYLIRWMLRPIEFMIGTGALASMTILITGTGQRLGDFLAGTCVVRTKRKVAFSKNLFPEFEKGYNPTYPDVIKLNDQDVNIIKEVIRTYSRSHDSQLLQLMVQRIKDHLDIEPVNQTNLQFLRSIVKDHHHIHGKI